MFLNDILTIWIHPKEYTVCEDDDEDDMYTQYSTIVYYTKHLTIFLTKNEALIHVLDRYRYFLQSFFQLLIFQE
jgi:hypothetical protein